MDVIPRKRSQVVALRKHTSLNVRAIGERLGIAKSIVGRIVKRAEDVSDVNIHRRGRCGRKNKATAHDDKMIIRNSVKALRKRSQELQRDLATSGVIIDSSTIRKRLLSAGRIARKPSKSNGYWSELAQ